MQQANKGKRIAISRLEISDHWHFQRKKKRSVKQEQMWFGALAWIFSILQAQLVPRDVSICTNHCFSLLVHTNLWKACHNMRKTRSTSISQAYHHRLISIWRNAAPPSVCYSETWTWPYQNHRSARQDCKLPATYGRSPCEYSECQGWVRQLAKGRKLEVLSELTRRRSEW